MQVPKPKRLPTKKDYEDLRGKIKLALQQLAPDGKCCSICGDNDHQAWECHHNPLSIAYQAQHFRCFHCGLIFTSEESALAHFGGRNDLLPECAGESYRALEELLSNLPATWYPALIIHMIEVSHKKNVFQTYGATRVARSTERKIKEGK